MKEINGVVETHYGNGQLESRSHYKNDKLNGLREIWYENGEMGSRENFLPFLKHKKSPKQFGLFIINYINHLKIFSDKYFALLQVMRILILLPY